MGLMNKLKNILFEEEEVEIPIIEKKPKKELKSSEIPKELPKEEPKERYNKNYYEDLAPTINRESTMEEQAKKIINNSKENNEPEIVSDREMFKSEKTFNFPAFDEEEFQSVSKVTRQTNILEHTSKKSPKTEYKRVEKPETEKTKFKPSPIISPVYGILDKNYTPDEITTREDTSRKLDFDSVRNKAFGKTEEPKEEILEVTSEEKDYDNKILEEKLEKARTIDELLKDSSDEVIPLRNNETYKEEEDEPLPLNKEDEEEAIISLDDTKKERAKEDDDTLESDLFDLIDSMYENREDGE